MPFFLLFFILFSQGLGAVGVLPCPVDVLDKKACPSLGSVLPGEPQLPRKKPKFSPDRGVLGNASRKFIQDFLSPSSVQSLVALSQELKDQGVKTYALNRGLSYADSLSQSFVSSLARSARDSYSSFFKQLDVHYTSNLLHPKTWEGEVSTLLALWETRNTLLFSQVNFLDGAEKRATLNVGVGLRHMNDSHSLLVGTNAFFDRDFKGKNNRLSVGVEAKASLLSLSANYYRRLTDWHISPMQPDKNIVTEERPANGYDLRGQFFLPFLQQVKLTGRLFRWKGNSVNLFSQRDTTKGTPDPTGYGVGVDYQPNRIFDVGVEYAHGLNNTQRTLRLTAGMHYQFGLSLKDQMSFSSPEMDVASHLYDKVDRENRIILEKRKLVDIPLKKSYVLRKSQVVTFPFKYTIQGVAFYDKTYVTSLDWDIPLESKPFFTRSSDGTSLVFHLDSPPALKTLNFLYDHPYPFSLTVTLKSGETIQRSSSFTVRAPLHLSVDPEYVLNSRVFNGHFYHQEIIPVTLSGYQAAGAHLQWTFIGKAKSFMKETHDSLNNAVFYVKKYQSPPQIDVSYAFQVRAVAKDGTKTPLVSSSVRVADGPIFVLKRSYTLGGGLGNTKTIRAIRAHLDFPLSPSQITWRFSQNMGMLFKSTPDRRSVVYTYTGTGKNLAYTGIAKNLALLSAKSENYIIVSVKLSPTLTFTRRANISLSKGLSISFPPGRVYTLDTSRVPTKWPLPMTIEGPHSVGATLHVIPNTVYKAARQYLRQEKTGTRQPYFTGKRGWHYLANFRYVFVVQAVSKDHVFRSKEFHVLVFFKEGALSFAQPLIVNYATGFAKTTVRFLNPKYKGSPVASLRLDGLSNDLNGYLTPAPDRKSVELRVPPATSFPHSLYTFFVHATLSNGTHLERKYTVHFLGSGVLVRDDQVKVYADCSSGTTKFYADNLANTSLFTRFFHAGLQGLHPSFSLAPHQVRVSVGSSSGNHCAEAASPSLTVSHTDMPLRPFHFPPVSQIPQAVKKGFYNVQEFSPKQRAFMDQARNIILQRFNQGEAFYKSLAQDDSLARILKIYAHPNISLAQFFWSLHHVMLKNNITMFVYDSPDATGAVTLCLDTAACYIGFQKRFLLSATKVSHTMIHELIHAAGYYNECVAYEVGYRFGFPVKRAGASTKGSVCSAGANWGGPRHAKDFFQFP